jgi:hypothetical protein
MTEFSGSPSLVLQTSTRTGESDGPATPARAGKMKEPTQSNSHANSSFLCFFGIVDGSGDPNRM